MSSDWVKSFSDIAGYAKNAAQQASTMMAGSELERKLADHKNQVSRFDGIPGYYQLPIGAADDIGLALYDTGPGAGPRGHGERSL